MTYYYPYSEVYLRERMRGISLGLVKLAIYGTSTVIAFAVLIAAFQFIVSFF